MDVTHIPTGAPDFTVEMPHNPDGAVVSAAEFGLGESGNDGAAAINRALGHCKSIRASKLVLPAGTYRCFGPRGIVLDGLSHFTVDGQGATLVFRRESDFSNLPQYAVVEDSANVVIKNCTHVKVGNFTMDWDWDTDPLGAFVRIVDKHADDDGGHSYVDVGFIGYTTYPLYPDPVPIQVLTPMTESLDGFSSHGHSMYFGPSEGHFGTRSEWLSPNTLRIYPAVKPEGVPLSDAYDYVYGAEKNRKAVTYAVVVGTVYRLMHYYYGKNGINMDANCHLTLEDINVRSCRGMGMHVDGKQSYWQVRNVSVSPPPDAAIKRPCTTTADVYHFARSCGYCKLLNCDFSLNQDDIINVHDRTTFVRKVSDTRVAVINQRGMDYFRAEPQDTLELFRGDATPLDFTARILSIDGETMELDRPVPEQEGEGFLAADRSCETANVLIKDCRFKNYYGRAIIVCGNTTIENCLFQNGPRIPMKLAMACTIDKWSEGSGWSNAVVRNCVFDNNNITLSAPDGFISDIFCGARVDPAMGFSRPYKGAISGVLIEGNTFRNMRGLLLLAESGENITVRNNVIQQTAAGPGAERYVGSVLSNSAADVTVENNQRSPQ